MTDDCHYNWSSKMFKIEYRIFYTNAPSLLNVPSSLSLERSYFGFYLPVIRITELVFEMTIYHCSLRFYYLPLGVGPNDRCVAELV